MTNNQVHDEESHEIDNKLSFIYFEIYVDYFKWT